MTGDYKLDNLLALLLGVLFLPLVLGLARRLGLYAIIAEREAQVFTLFGKVLGTLDEPGIRFPSAISASRPCWCPFSANCIASIPGCARIICGIRW